LDVLQTASNNGEALSPSSLDLVSEILSTLVQARSEAHLGSVSERIAFRTTFVAPVLTEAAAIVAKSQAVNGPASSTVGSSLSVVVANLSTAATSAAYGVSRIEHPRELATTSLVFPAGFAGAAVGASTSSVAVTITLDAAAPFASCDGCSSPTAVSLRLDCHRARRGRCVKRGDCSGVFVHRGHAPRAPRI